jgi:hypothetical protein
MSELTSQFNPFCGPRVRSGALLSRAVAVYDLIAVHLVSVFPLNGGCGSNIPVPGEGGNVRNPSFPAIQGAPAERLRSTQRGR